jgi:hypothetical protein
MDPLPRELFKKVVPYHCLDSMWSQQDMKGKKYLAPTIRNAITQFETVVSSVITTCLGDQSLKASDRAQVVEHWIEVAMVCSRRDLGKPFSHASTLRSGLWSEPLPTPSSLLQVVASTLTVYSRGAWGESHPLTLYL